MVSQAQIDANKRNAAKSTGPRTAEGKTNVKFNAVTHGLTAATVVLPHEDAQAYQHRLESWTSELKAPGDFGQYLVARLVKISWQLDRADTFEQAKLTKRIQDAPRLFGKSHAEPAETLIARLIGTEKDQPAEKEPVHSPSARRQKRAGPDPDEPLAPLLRALESSAEGCRLLLSEWTRILDWLGKLRPDGITTSEIHTRLDNLVRALGLLGVRVADPDDLALAATTADPLAVPFLRAWQAVKDQAIRELMEQELDEDDDPPPPEGPELATELIASRWAEVGAALRKLAAERCARLKTVLAQHQEGEVEARARLAYEASFDDSAEGERLHRYQARWGRSLLRTLAALEELRDRGEAVIGRGSPADEDEMSHGCTQTNTDETAVPRCVIASSTHPTGLTSDNVSSISDEQRSSDAGAGLAGGEREAVMEMGSAARQKEKRQNKPTAVTRTLVKRVKMEPCVERPVGSKANMADSPCRRSDLSGDRNGHSTRAAQAIRRHIPHDPPHTAGSCLGQAGR